jgi:hypothetical protein
LVWDPPKQQVNVTRMMIYSLIPILSIYAGWRIQRFWLLFIVNFVVGVLTGFVGAALEASGMRYVGIILGLAIGIPISLLLVRKFAIEYNERISRETGATSSPSPSF